MGYLFRGFFAPYADGLMEAAAQRWPGASVCRIHEPFDGIGLRLPYADPDNPPEYIMVVECEDELPEWTTNFPGLKFVYIYADCWGSDRIYYGYVCKNGEKIAEEIPEYDALSNPGALTRLLLHLGARLGQSEHFQPFARNYPW